MKKLQHRDAYQHGQVTQLPSDEAVCECRRLRLIPLWAVPYIQESVKWSNMALPRIHEKHTLFGNNLRVIFLTLLEFTIYIMITEIWVSQNEMTLSHQIIAKSEGKKCTFPRNRWAPLTCKWTRTSYLRLLMVVFLQDVPLLKISPCIRILVVQG